MTFEEDLCKIFYHDWIKKDDWSYCDRCNKKYNFHEDWTEYCLRSDRKLLGYHLLRCGPEDDKR